MEKDLDSKLYNEYFQGKKEIFDLLYSKYKSKLEFFIFNIVKDYQKAEDIVQDVFIYVFQNQPKENFSFKNYLYLVGKCRSISYIKNEKNRENITEKYLNDKEGFTEPDILKFITNQETKKELIKSINELDDRYKNAIYLTQIEELSYKEASKILGEPIQNIKNYVHRGKKKLRNSFLKKKFDNSVLKTILIIIFATSILTGITYASIAIYEKIWKNPIEFSNEQEYLEQYKKKEILKKEKMNNTEPVSIDSIVILGQNIFDNLGYKYSINQDDVTIIEETADYYYRIDIDKFSLIFSKDGEFTSFCDNKLFYDFNTTSDAITEEKAKEIANSIFNSIRIGINNEYNFRNAEKIYAANKQKSVREWRTVFFQKCDELTNYYNSIEITFRVVNNEVLIVNILKRNSDYIYENNELQISKKQAIETARNCDRKISLLDIATIDAELAIRDMNSFVYAQEKTQGMEDEWKDVVLEDGSLTSYKGYYNEEKLRKVWNIKIKYFINENKENNLNESYGRNYYVDATTGEIIGGDWTRNDEAIDQIAYFKIDYSNITSDSNENTGENNNILNKNIKKRGELHTNGLYNYNGDIYAFFNNMIWNYAWLLRYQIVQNIDDYNKYIDRISIPKMNESDLENSALIVVVNEHTRADNEKDLMIYDVYSDETTTYIVMKQKENPNLTIHQELLNNVFYAIVDKSIIKENVQVMIKH